MIDKIIPSRITEAREARSLSMGDLADSINITRQSVSKYERGIINPSFEVLQEISVKLDFPLDYFYKKDVIDTARSSSLFFRSKSNVVKKIKTACRYQVKWTNEVKKELERYVDFLDVDIPTIDVDYEEITDEDIEELAINLRDKWNIGDGPIDDLIGILENKGVIVSQFSSNNICSFSGIDAFSAWKDGVPYIVYNSVQKSAVRTRFSILHELGHIIMHSAISEEESTKREIVDFADMQADRFAAAFLLPATSFPNSIRGTSLSVMEIAKVKWGAAISTIIKRCENLELLTENQLNYLKRQMSTNKYWHKEPLDDVLTIKGPELLRDAILMLIENNVLTKDSFINNSALPRTDLKCICGLPDDFFDDFIIRQKPILRVLKT